MRQLSSDVVNLRAEAAGDQKYDNHPVAQVNDHVIIIATMTGLTIGTATLILMNHSWFLRGGVCTSILTIKLWNLSRLLCSPSRKVSATVPDRSACGRSI